jgi:cysteine desulfurase
MIYLDYAANTPVDPEVLETFCEVSRDYAANPNSPHQLGRMAGERLDAATKRIVHLLNLGKHEIIYTSGATESNNLAIKGIAQKNANTGRHIITTYLEHSSVNGAAAALQESGYEVDYVENGKDGLADLDSLRDLMRKDTVLVSICYVDSEAGVTQQIDEIGDLISHYPNCRYHVDATQAVGKIPISLRKADLFSFAPHKFYGLNGSGILVKKEDVPLEPQIHGGISTSPYRSGTPALGLIAATARALDLAMSSLDGRLSYVTGLNRKLRNALKGYKRVEINSPERSSPYILSISIPGVKTEELRAELEKYGVFLSNRSACCAPNTVSRPIYAITKDRRRALSPLRISLSHLTEESELDEFLNCFDACMNKFAQ